MTQNDDIETMQNEIVRLVQAGNYQGAYDLINYVAARSHQAEKLKQELEEQKSANKRLEEKIQELQEPPLSQGIILGPSPDDEKSVIIGSGSQRMEVRIAADTNINPADLRPGDEAWLNQDRQIVKVRQPYHNGEVGEIIGVLEDGRLEVKSRGNEGMVLQRIDSFQDPLQIGDRVRVDAHLGIAFEKLPTQNTKELELEEVPDVTYEEIGGLGEQIEEIRDAIELPYLYNHLFRYYHLKRPKGILLYGPPGCGKTMIAKAIANNLTTEISKNVKNIESALSLLLHVRGSQINETFMQLYLAWEQSIWKNKPTEEDESSVPSQPEIEKRLSGFLDTRGIDTTDPMIALESVRVHLSEKSQAYFMSIKGPELLNKYVGETEHSIRKLFLQAKRRASFSTPVIIFFDEIEALFRRRGSRVSSDVESTIVPQFLSEIDGVEALNNVIIIGATNRQDLLDPAILRPGRLDTKIKINRPDSSAALDILGKYLKSDLPLNAIEVAVTGSAADVLTRMSERVVRLIYSENSMLRVSGEPMNGQTRTFPCRDFISGAMLENIVSRAKKRAVKREIDVGQRGLRWQDLRDSVVEEFEQNKDQMVSTTLNIPEEGLEIMILIPEDDPVSEVNSWLQLVDRPWREHIQREFAMSI